MQRQSRKERGFTLVELAIALVIVAFFVAGALVSVSQFLKAQKITETRAKMDFVLNVMSTYVQQHNRLPCPADPSLLATNAARGHEMDYDLVSHTGKCFNNATNAALYTETEGIVPWAELGIPQSMVIDAWGHYFTYKPAPNLTADMNDPYMQNATVASATDIHNACRTAMWYDSTGNHVNRAKALFCCDAQPSTQPQAGAGSTYLQSKAYPGGNISNVLNTNWRATAILDTDTAKGSTTSTSGNLLAANPSVLGTPNWIDKADDGNVNGATYGAFTNPTNGTTQNVLSPLLRASGPAITLISHGADGYFAFMPEQPKDTRIGGTSVNTATGDAATNNANVPLSEQANAGWPQMFAAVLGHPKQNSGTFDLLNGGDQASDDIVATLRTDQLYGRVGNASCTPTALKSYQCVSQSFSNSGAIILKGLMPGQKYNITGTFNPSGPGGSQHMMLGFYTYSPNGAIANVVSVTNDTTKFSSNAASSQGTISLTAPSGGQTTSLGVFILPSASGDTHNPFETPNPASYFNPNLDILTGNVKNTATGTYNTLEFVNQSDWAAQGGATTFQSGTFNPSGQTTVNAPNGGFPPATVMDAPCSSGSSCAPLLVSVSTDANGNKTATIINGLAGPGLAYHSDGWLNPNQENRTLETTATTGNNEVCTAAQNADIQQYTPYCYPTTGYSSCIYHVGGNWVPKSGLPASVYTKNYGSGVVGDFTGVNGDMLCNEYGGGGTSDANSGASDPDKTGQNTKMQMGFENIPWDFKFRFPGDAPANANAYQSNPAYYEMSDGTQQSNPAAYIAAQALLNKTVTQRTDQNGGYIAQVGDHSYADAYFTFSMTACPTQ